MDAATKEKLLNGALQIAFDATGLIPGLAEAHGALRLAVDAAPVVEAAYDYFQTDEGRRAISHVRAVFGAIQPTSPMPLDWSMAKAIDALEKGEA